MKVDQLPDGRTIADTAALAAVTARSRYTIRRHCPRETDGYDVATAETILAQVQEPVLLTTPDIWRYLGIPAGTVYSWASRGVLRSYDRDGRGRPLYDAADIAALHDANPKG